MKVNIGRLYPMREEPKTPFASVTAGDCTRVRWITGQCVQMGLPGGKTLLVDPIFPHSPCWKAHLGDKTPDLRAEELGRVDYILITHSHCDHTDGIPEVLERNPGAIVVCSALFASQASLVYKIPCYNMRPILNGQSFDFGSFRLSAFRSVHVDLGVTADPASLMGFMDKSWGGEAGADWEQLNGLYGTLHGSSYMITLPDGFRIGYATGTKMDELALDSRWREARPNFLIRHRVFYTNAKEYAAECLSLGGQAAMTVDHEAWLDEDNDVNAFCAEANDELRKRGSGMKIFSPKRYRWYRLQLTACEE